MQAPVTSANSALPAGSWRTVRRKILRYAERGFAIFGLMVLIYLLFFNLSVMVSPSMSPTLQGTNIDNGDHVLTERMTKWFRSPRRFEVVAFTNDEGVQVMKRIIGLPGEQVQLPEEGKLLINDQPIELPPTLDLKYLRYGNLADGKPLACGNGYYVLGDHTRDSDDSRFNGPIQPHRIIGRAWLIVWPISRFGFVW
jgi:signal peptidase I